MGDQIDNSPEAIRNLQEMMDQGPSSQTPKDSIMAMSLDRLVKFAESERKKHLKRTFDEDAPPKMLDKFRNETIEEEIARLQKLQQTDLSRWQRITNVSSDLYSAVKSLNVAEARRIGLSAQREELLQCVCFRCFFWAVRSVNMELVELFVEDLGLPYDINPESKYCCHDMVEHLDLKHFCKAAEIIRILYRGPCPMPVDFPRPSDGYSLMCIAANHGFGSIVWELMLAGGDLKFAAPDGMTPLKLAVAGEAGGGRQQEQDQRAMLQNLFEFAGLDVHRPSLERLKSQSPQAEAAVAITEQDVVF